MRFTKDFLTAELTLEPSPVLAAAGTMRVDVRFENNPWFEDMQHPLALRWILPDGFRVACPSTVLMGKKDIHHGGPNGCAQAVITAPETLAGTHRLILEITVPGRHTALYCSFPVFSK